MNEQTGRIRCRRGLLYFLVVSLGMAGPAAGGYSRVYSSLVVPAKPLELVYIANSGALIISAGHKVLIDALYDKPNPDYRAPSPEMLDKIMKGAPPFDGVDLVLVTHSHPDHFDAKLAARYMEAWPQVVLAAPADAAAELRKAAADWAKIEPRVVSFDLAVGKKESREIKGIPVTACRTLHSGDRDSPMNLMYDFALDGRRVFHEGDANSKIEAVRGFGLEGRPLDLALVHYWFPLEPDFSKFVLEDLKPEHVALTHLPIRLESDAPGKIDMVRKSYKDIFLLQYGMPAKTLYDAEPMAGPVDKKPMPRSSGLDRPLETGQAVLWYLFHSGWAVRTKSHFMVFDYFEPAEPPERRSLDAGSIDPAEIADQNVIVFVTHGHPDHFLPAILDWRAAIKKIRYVWGWEGGGPPSDVHFGAERKTVTVDGIKAANVHHEFDGIPESAFLVKIDGLTILHSGDHGHHNGMENPVYKDNTLYLAGLAPRLDLFLTPTFAGVENVIRVLKPSAVLPMHDGGNEKQYGIFSRRIAPLSLNTQVGVAVRQGSRFFYSRGKIISE